MKLLYCSLAFFLSLSQSIIAAADPVAEPAETATPVPQTPCTIRSPKSGAFFDLSPLHIVSTEKNPRNTSWVTTGYDLPYNFTLNFCGGVVEDLASMGREGHKGPQGVPRELWKNVSAFYEFNNSIYSIGQRSEHPIIRGRKLILNYTSGSPCPDRSNWDKDDDSNGDGSYSKTTRRRRKTTIISMLCEPDPLRPTLTLSFIASPDECSYFFEARGRAGCPGIEVSKQELSPSGVFGVIALVAILVYVVGGCVYSRMVLNQRGWKQLPNYSLWAGMMNCFGDVFYLLTSSCTRLIPGLGSDRRRVHMNGNVGSGGMGHIRSSGNGGSRRSIDAENRLIDELNEEWDDL